MVIRCSARLEYKSLERRKKEEEDHLSVEATMTQFENQVSSVGSFLPFTKPNEDLTKSKLRLMADKMACNFALMGFIT